MFKRYASIFVLMFASSAIPFTIFLITRADANDGAEPLILMQRAWKQSVEQDGDTAMGNNVLPSLRAAMQEYATRHPQAAEEAATAIRSHGGIVPWR